MGGVDNTVGACYNEYVNKVKSRSEGMKKVHFVLFFLLTITLCLLCFSSCANNEFQFGDYRYTVENNEVTIKNYIGNDEEVIIPESIDGMPVVAIGDAVFNACDNIRSVTIPDSVVEIGALVFSKCYSLETVTLGRGVREIGFSPFAYCEKVIYNEYENGYYIGNSENPYLALVSIISADVEAITIHPDTVVICGSAMESCHFIRELVFPNSVVSIGSYALRYCSSLETVHIPESMEFIDHSVFGHCNSLLNIVVSDKNPHFKSVDGSLFSRDGTSLIQYTKGRKDNFYRIPDGTVIIKSGAFENAKHLTEIVISDSVEEIGIDAFYRCENLRNVQFGNSLKIIKSGAFQSCSSLTEITIPDSVEELHNTVFNMCKNLESVVIGSGVVRVEPDVFSGCEALNSVTFRVPKGWRVSGMFSLFSEKIDLSDPRKNADYLTGEYCGYYWYRR